MSSPTTALRRDEAGVKGTRVLVVEDNPVDGELVKHELQRAGLETVDPIVQTVEDLRRRIRTDCPDIILTDYNLGQWQGMDVLQVLREERLEIPVIVVSGALGDVTAVECIKQGASDYVLKDSLARLPISIRRALEDKRNREEREAAQEELAKRVEELARSNRDLEQFAYVASHDLQEPLRMVAAYTQLLGERYKGKLDEQADKYIHYAVDGAQRMQTLIQDLLAFSRAGRQGDMKRTECDAVLSEALTNLEALILESKAVVHRDPLPAVNAIASQLRQVFQNLIGNAIKFRGQAAPVVHIGAEPDGEAWRFSVKDNGIGMAPDDIQNIFVVFRRLHTREEYPGNGIGLAICKKIIERHGGKIWVESEPGQGTTFLFTLPAQEAPEKFNPQSHEQTSRDLVSR